MADQKALKKRLKVLMSRPENQVCSDCPERQPRWASLIVPPPGAPEGSLPIGAFCCLECSGSHRRLGVHISFVRSINLDSWKEKEVLAMENGGNAKVNAIFEARLPGQHVKPHNHADGATRERFIRDKYERRKYFDSAGFAEYARMAAAAAAAEPPRTNKSPPSRSNTSGSESDRGATRRTLSGNVGPPSAAAQRRLEERRNRIQNSQPDRNPGGFGNFASASNKPKRQIAKAPVSAPLPVADLLDFGSGGFDQPVASEPQMDFFNAGSNEDLFGTGNNASQPAQASAPAPQLNQGNNTQAATQTQSSGQSGAGGLDMFDFLTKDMDKLTTKTEPQKKENSFDIMSLYSSNNHMQPQSFMNPNDSSLNQSMPSLMSYMSDSSGQQANGHGNNMSSMNPQQANPQMMMMMQQQQQAQQRNPMMYQQQQQQMNNNMMGNNMMMQGNNMMGNNMMMQGNNMMMQGNNMMNNNMMNNNMMMMQGGNNNMMMQQQQQALQMPGYGNQGYGAPMGSGPPMGIMTSGGSSKPAKKQSAPQKEDPFAQFGKSVFQM